MADKPAPASTYVQRKPPAAYTANTPAVEYSQQNTLPQPTEAPKPYGDQPVSVGPAPTGGWSYSGPMSNAPAEVTPNPEPPPPSGTGDPVKPWGSSGNGNDTSPGGTGGSGTGNPYIIQGTHGHPVDFSGTFGIGAGPSLPQIPGTKILGPLPQIPGTQPLGSAPTGRVGGPYRPTSGANLHPEDGSDILGPEAGPSKPPDLPFKRTSNRYSA